MNFDVKRMVKFEHNIGAKEKQYRLYGGIAAAAVSVFLGNVFLLVVGVVLIATGYSGWCPVYSGLNKNTLDATAGPADAGQGGDGSNPQ